MMGAATLNSPPQLACSVDEASEATGLSPWSLRYLMKSGRLGYAKVGRRILIPLAELERPTAPGHCEGDGFA
jgi:excisionase family DNA binding protein